MVVFDHGQPHTECREGVTLYSWTGKHNPSKVVPEDRASLHWLRFRCLNILLITRTWIRRRLYRIGRIGPHAIESANVAIYDDVDADIYIMHGNSDLAAELAVYCKQRGKKYVFLAGSDGDYHPGYKAHPEAMGIYGLPGYLLVYAIENASVHIVQSKHQAELLRQTYGRSSVVVKSPLELGRTSPKETEPDTILWIGKSDWIKRPEIVLQLARQFPEYHFVVIINCSNRQIHARCIREAEALSNVTLLHYVPYSEVEGYFAKAKLLVNTSIFEGFPNTFLQAAKYEVPIVSYQVDPGEMISKHECGLLCDGDFERLKENVRLLMTTPSFYAARSANCLQYIKTHHDKDKIIKEFEDVLVSVCQKPFFS